MKPSVITTHSRNLLTEPSYKVKNTQTEFCFGSFSTYILWNAPSTSIFRLPQSREDFQGKSSMPAADLWKNLVISVPMGHTFDKLKTGMRLFQSLWSTNVHWKPINVVLNSFECIISNVNENNLSARAESRTENYFPKYLFEYWSTLNSIVSFCFSQIFKTTSMTRKDPHNLRFFCFNHTLCD